MTITLGLEEITFEEPTQLLVREMRDLYISGFKNGNADDFEKFLDASRSNLEVVGVERIDNAAELVRAYVDDIPKKSVQWGIGYIKGFMGWM